MTSQIFTPTVTPAVDFDCSKDCERLFDAMKGSGTDEAGLISVLCKRSWQQRLEIKEAYKENLADEISKETSGDFSKVLKRLLMHPTRLAAYETYKAFKKTGTDEDGLIELLCTRSSQELREIDEKYVKMYKRTIESDVDKKTKGSLKRLLLLLLKFERPTHLQTVWVNVPADAETLHIAATDDDIKDDDKRETFIEIFCNRSFWQLRAIFDCYEASYAKNLRDVIKNEFSSDLEKALIAIFDNVYNRPAYFARQLHDAIKGAGTHDEWLIRIIVGRCELDLGVIDVEYNKIYGKSLAKVIKSETSGDYKKALLALAGDDKGKDDGGQE